MQVRTQLAILSAQACRYFYGSDANNAMPDEALQEKSRTTTPLS